MGIQSLGCMLAFDCTHKLKNIAYVWNKKYMTDKEGLVGIILSLQENMHG